MIKPLIFIFLLFALQVEDLRNATVIDADTCTISAIGIGSSYEDVISALGEPASEPDLVEDPVPKEMVRMLEYEGVTVILKFDLVTMISSERSGVALHGGIGPDSTRTELLAKLGESATDSFDVREAFVYRCGDTGTWLGQVMLTVVLENERVTSVTVMADDELYQGE